MRQTECLIWGLVSTLTACSLYSVTFSQSLRCVLLLIMLDQIVRVSKYCFAMVTMLCAALLFSATFRKKVEKLCRDILTDPVRIVVGTLGEVFSYYGYLLFILTTLHKG